MKRYSQAAVDERIARAIQDKLSKKLQVCRFPNRFMVELPFKTNRGSYCEWLFRSQSYFKITYRIMYASMYLKVHPWESNSVNIISLLKTFFILFNRISISFYKLPVVYNVDIILRSATINSFPISTVRGSFKSYKIGLIFFTGRKQKALAEQWGSKETGISQLNITDTLNPS